MKKLFAVVVFFILALALVGCGTSSKEVAAVEEKPLIPVTCGEETLYVELGQVEEYRKACEPVETTEIDVVCEPNVEKIDKVEKPVGEPVVVVSAAKACGYDYNVMPKGVDEYGNPLADEGVSYVGEIVGPALVQLDSLTVVSVFPGEVYDVPEGDIVTWKYTGDDACLRSQYQWFPGKTFIPIDSVH